MPEQFRVAYRRLGQPARVGRAAATRPVMAHIASLSPNSYVNVMAQYCPAFRAAETEEINRPLTGEEYRQAIKWAQQAGLHRLDKIDI